MTNKFTPQATPKVDAPLPIASDDVRGWESDRMRAARVSDEPVTTTRVMDIPAWAKAGQRAALLLSGQGARWTDDCAAILQRSPRARRVFKRACLHIDAYAATLRPHNRAPFAGGFSLDIEDPDRPAVSAPGVVVAQLLRFALLQDLGVPLTRETVAALVGHSQGALGAACLSSIWDLDDVDERAEATGPWLELAMHLGLRMEEGTRPAAPAILSAAALEDGVGAPTPMASLRGLLTQELRALTVDVDGVFVSAVHGPTEHTVAGEPAALERVRQAVNARAEAALKAKRAGKTAGRTLHPEWTYLPVHAPFHTPLMHDALEGLEADIEATKLEARLRPLVIPVLSPTTGAAIERDVARSLAKAILVDPMSWRASLDGALHLGASLLVDVGPTDAAARLSAIALRGRGVAIVAAADARGEEELRDPARTPAPRWRAWDAYAPRLVGGRVDNRFTRSTGRAPVVLPGMTPTTVEAPIVVAAANAGFVAELAGGGQVTEAILRERLDEICEGLEPGNGVVFNALYLDPYLWGLHFSERGLVPRLKAEGYPILGVTVSAGIPPLDEAVALLERFEAIGMTLNAFKPGTSAQVAEVLAIADAFDGEVHMHLEGGRAGGHHSWEDLDDLLLRNYDAIRRHDNVVLSVVAVSLKKEKSTAYLTGAWAEAYDHPRMPVDGVLLGTRLMATREARTSASVKAMLAEVKGHPERWPLDGEHEAGLTSGRSQLDASIYYVDNAAAACGRLLDAVAGDAEKVAARRDEIARALSRTAKPFFGELTRMTYADVLRRLVELTAFGQGGRYEDGRWPDQSYRARFEAIFQRAEERLADAAGPSLLTSDPDDAIDALVAAWPRAEETLLHAEDIKHFIGVCRRPGKPVCFVPVIDENVRRWYKADSLWQSHDDRLDADGVLVIPGPAGVHAIERADEPVAEVLGGFVAHLTDALVDSADLDEAGPLAAALRAPNVFVDGVRVSVNPLAAVIAGCTLDEREEDGRLVHVDVREASGALCASLSLSGGELSCELLIRAGGDEPRALPLHLSWADDHVAWDRAAFLRAQREVLGGFMRNERACLTAETLRDFRAATGDDTDGVPLSLAFVLGWSEIFEAMCSADGDLFRLVHETNTSEAGLAWPPAIDEPIRVDARVSSTEDLAEGRRVATTATLHTDRGVLATVDSSFFIRETLGLDVGARRLDRGVRDTLVLGGEGDRAFLASLDWVEDIALDDVALGAPLTLEATLQTDGGHGVIRGPQGEVARIALDGAGDDEHPIEVLRDLLASPASRVDVEPVRLGRKQTRAPRALEAYAFASGDRNPLHLDPVVGRLAGFDAPIVHGMWTAAVALHRVVRLAADSDASRVSRVEAKFLSPLSLGADLGVDVDRVAHDRGAQLIEATASAGDAPVVSLEARIAPRPTAYVYPGQGTHAPGMGMDAYQRSEAARAVWDEADRTTRDRFGFSLLDVVRDNPREIWVRGERFSHPKGVLYLTQFTQVALAVLAVAQTRELEEDGLLDEDARYAGHSLGEYSALAALGGVMPLEGVVEIVYQRGLTMDRLIERDEDGRSPYAMGVIRPHVAGLDEAGAFALVDRAAAETGLPLEVVNHNVRGRQYTVTGHTDAIDALKSSLGEAWIDVPGIDVPFHSTLLRDGVAAFRAKLESAVPDVVDPARLEGRYLPNLTGTVFRLEPAFYDEVRDACGSDRVEAWHTSDDRGALAREILIEVLAWQFASPVRWIQTQDILLEDGTALVEVGAAHAPTLVGMARSTLRKNPAHDVRVVHAVTDRAALFGPAEIEVDAEPAPVVEEAPEAPEAQAPVVAAAPAPVAPAPSSGAPLADDANVVRSGLTTLFALLAKKDPTSFDDGVSLDKIVGGNSARRNQILADLGAEFDAKAMDGAHELPLRDLAEKLSAQAGYRGEGAFLKPQLQKALSATFAPHGLDRGALEAHLDDRWGVPPSHRVCILHDVAVSARGLMGEEPAARDKKSALAWLDAVAARYAARNGLALTEKAATAAVASVDGAALVETERRLTDALTSGARALADAFGVDVREGHEIKADAEVSREAQVLANENEHGDDYARAIAPRFAAQRHVAFTSAWAWARRDLLDAKAALDRGEDVDLEDLARRLDDDGRRAAAALGVELPEADVSLAFRGRTALVTGAGPGSIALAIIAGLLRGGARVIATTSSYGPERLRLMKEVYQESAVDGAELHVVPFNQGSFDDVDALAAWLRAPIRERVGSHDKVVKQPMIPDLLLPFAAYPETADLTGVGPRSMASLRVNLLGVERLVARLSELAGHDDKRVRVVLPLSPNHGGFGGDGAYGESKAALEVLMNKWRSEQDAWGARTSLVGAKIGWVRGTGLMKQNDDVALSLHDAGLTTFSTEEMAALILERCHGDEVEPFTVDLTGGLGDLDDVGALLKDKRVGAFTAEAKRRRLEELRRAFDERTGGLEEQAARIRPRRQESSLAPLPSDDELAGLPALEHLDADEVVVICGFGEVGPYGSARTRWDVEKGGPLSLEAVAELAWTMGLVEPDEKGEGFVDAASKEPVADDELAERYEAQILEHAGVRVTEPGVVGFDPNDLVQLVEVHLDRDFSFPAPSREAAESMRARAPDHTEIRESDSGEIIVVRKKGAVLRVPSSLKLNRHVTGQVPTGWDPARLGIPQELIDQVDPVTLYCLVSTADAFLAAGLEPEEIYRTIHPGRVGITLGTGIGGMKKLMQLHRDHYDGEERQNDTLQETLINVIGGYVVQSYLGSYGPMSFPVGACATAGLSVADGVDKILQGAADIIVAGGADDLSEAGLVGFGDMGATADTRDLEDRGVAPRHMSRPSDTRRRGFVEAQGAGVLLLARASVAAKMGLPVYGVVAYAGTSGDGLQRSVPAPGQGALVAVTGESDAADFDRRRDRLRELESRRGELVSLLGEDDADATLRRARRELAHQGREGMSPLASALSVLGLVGDDVAVVSKHDSSTQANDENEARLHTRIAKALGRTPGLPLPVISQKALTGHPKGAAAAWQMNGLMQAMAEGVLPGNPSLDDVSAELREFSALVATDRARRVPRASLKAGLVTTLGFGHVSALVCLAHPFLFWRMLDEETRASYEARLRPRLQGASAKLASVIAGETPLVEVRTDRPFASAEEEARVLMDPGARL
jgi:fatty acid synthase